MSEAATAAPNPPPQSPRPTAQPQRLHGLPPVLGRQTVVLVLGSFPGAASLAAGQYQRGPG